MTGNQTSEMKIYNHIATKYEECLLSGMKNDALQIAKNAQEYLSTLPHLTKMYGCGKRWVTAGELIGYNKARINRLERECYSVELGGAHRRNDQ